MGCLTLLFKSHRAPFCARYPGAWAEDASKTQAKEGTRGPARSGIRDEGVILYHQGGGFPQARLDVGPEINALPHHLLLEQRFRWWA